MKGLLFFLAFFVCVGGAFGVGGDMGIGTDPKADGSAEHPWLIEDLADFIRFAGDSSYHASGICTLLKCDLDLSRNGTYLEAPIYFFRGSFDGNGHTISNLNIDGDDRLGLFGFVSPDAIVRNIGVLNCSISGSYNIGGLVGENWGNIFNCYSGGSVNGGSEVGGLVGRCSGSISITDSHSTCTVTASFDNAGGLVGYNSSNISRCYATGQVKGKSNVGGLVGLNEYADTNIINSYSSGSVNGSGSWVGGLVGTLSSGSIIGCYSESSVVGNLNVGGLVGLCGSNSRKISNCYSVGLVEGASITGGFIGSPGCDLIGCFWDTETSGRSNGLGFPNYSFDRDCGKTTAEMQTMSTFTDAGWIFYKGYGDGEWYMPQASYPKLSWQLPIEFESQPLVLKKNMQGQLEINVFSSEVVISWELSGFEDCGWITEVSPVSGSSSGPEDRTVVTVKVDTAGLNSGNYTCDLLLVSNTGDSIIFPLELHVKLVGSGTVDEPYLIESLNDFDAFADLGSSDKYWAGGVYTKLACDIDLGGRVYDTAVIAPDVPDTTRFFDGIPYEGVFDGGGHVISNMTIDVEGADKSYISLFGLIGKREGSDAEVKMLGMENVSVTGGDDSHSVSGLCGDNLCGTISECYVTGAITGNRSMGGLCGWNAGGTIINSYSTCSVTDIGGPGWSGGLCGANVISGTISNCYSSGLITGNESSIIGGLYGSGDDPINCFWDVQSSGTSDGAGNIDPDPEGVIGLTTNEMQTVSTFTDAGWGFVGESVNGDEDVWRLCVDGSGYPRLAWEYARVGDFVCGDGVDMDDFAYFAGEYGTYGDIDRADLDGDGVVGVLDLAVFCSHWLDD